MSVVDAPTISEQPVELGTFVIVRLDPVSSVRALEDEQATHEAAALAPRKYLVLVDTTGELSYTRAAGGLQLNLSFLVAGRNPPPSPHSWAAIPIHPTPAMHDSDREPITASHALALERCYIYTLNPVTALVSRIYRHHSHGPRLSDDEHDMVRYCMITDGNRAVDEQLALKASVDVIPALDDEDDGGLDAEPPDAVQADIETFFPRMHAEHRPEMQLHVELWVDVTALDDVAEPLELAQEIEKLNEIERDWARRYVAAQLSNPQTADWIEDAGGVDPVPEDVITDGWFDDDALVRPEDAIEHRIERQVHDEDNYVMKDDAATSTSTRQSSVYSITSSPASRVRRSKGAHPQEGSGVFSILWLISRLSGVLGRVSIRLGRFIWSSLRLILGMRPI
ncbi:hypothetical protein EXIGLDRAFT_748365 [Exidia glandulosa HHB12029]|uniref:Uncharacterized protein n=1 Tax=Exidia glandulosa HHB12029 TaxID=1314781 RepID=A0A165JIY2_EXIGL|nr:hypothetical protein EXIGLDRAFT_748365 [Exidia glandulosa HHB12029]